MQKQALWDLGGIEEPVTLHGHGGGSDEWLSAQHISNQSIEDWDRWNVGCQSKWAVRNGVQDTGVKQQAEGMTFAETRKASGQHTAEEVPKSGSEVWSLTCLMSTSVQTSGCELNGWVWDSGWRSGLNTGKCDSPREQMLCEAPRWDTNT